MELSQALRTGYFTALSGNITWDSKTVQIYDLFAPEDAELPYIILSTQTNSQRTVKGCKIYDATLLVDVVTRSIDPIGREQSEVIGGQVEDLINPDNDVDIDLTANGYQIGDTWRGEDTGLTTKSDQYYIYRKLMRYNHTINKL